jgi:hypothetical protein
MNALIHHLSNAGPWTAAAGLTMCIVAGYLREPFWERTGMWICIFAATELATLLILRVIA